MFRLAIFTRTESVSVLILFNYNKEHGASLFEGEFADESFHIKHTEVGLVGMCKRKGYAHSNEC